MTTDTLAWTTSGTATNVHVYAPGWTLRKIARIDCPTCERRTFAAGWHTEYYGWDLTCLRCGERWSDGERLSRPFRRGWRKDSIARAKARWRRP